MEREKVKSKKITALPYMLQEVVRGEEEAGCEWRP
jgi:hypothetical protein